MSQQYRQSQSRNTTWLDYCNNWIYTKRTLAERLDKGDLDIISAVSIVQVTLNGSTVSINWDGTSKIAYHGEMQSTIAGKQVTTDIWEIPLKKENFSGLENCPQILSGREFNSI